MTKHRSSYWKTTLATAFGALASGVLLALTSSTQLDFLAALIALKTNPSVFWILTAVLSAFGLVCLAVALGGVFALYGDAKESQRSARSFDCRSR